MNPKKIASAWTKLRFGQGRGGTMPILKEDLRELNRYYGEKLVPGIVARCVQGEPGKRKVVVDAFVSLLVRAKIANAEKDREFERSGVIQSSSANVVPIRR